MNQDTVESVIELRMKLRYAVEIEYFLDRSRSHFDDSTSTIELIARWSFKNLMNEDIFDVNTLSESVIDDDEFSSSVWSFW
jgi:hypothetical protein